MRELKFRAFNKKEKKMCKVVSTDFKQLVTIRFPEFDGLIGDFDDQMELIEFEPLMQYTGLTDKNGVEIYEGDIVNCSSGCPHKVYWEEEYAGTYVGGMPAWYLSGINTGYAWSGEEEVIGNIYENPELLEESK